MNSFYMINDFEDNFFNSNSLMACQPAPLTSSSTINDIVDPITQLNFTCKLFSILTDPSNAMIICWRTGKFFHFYFHFFLQYFVYFIIFFLYPQYIII